MALGAGHLLGAACSVYACSGDLQLLTLALSNAFPVSLGFAKAALLLARHRRYSALVGGVDALRARQRDFCDADPQLAAAFRETRRWSVKLTFLFFSSVLSALIVWSLLPLSMYPQVLASRIAGLRLRERTQKIKLCAESDDASTLHGDMYNELCLCVDTHKELIRLVGLLESLMNPVAMLQFLVGAVSSCVVLFSATYSPDSNSALKCWGSLPLLLTQLFLYCSGAQHILDQSEAVAMAAYDCAWCDSSSKLKRALQLVISRAQKPLALTAGKLYAVKRATFLSLIQATYSYYTLLQNLDN
ncbi:odorant receptor Or2-like [Schistocerca nitens]|uniref:odorant receptor Or2-like n=1 Tax=Schistocerca nitens TaxID=7011 RepID=UPI0021187C92|nr:odorant receptor Or2-like [Schistocerca nitens]